MDYKSEKQIRRKNNKSGAAMLIVVIFFLFISLAIISGLVSPTVREFRNASFNLNSKKSYFLAESGSEDALYRILKNMTIASSEILTLNNNSTTTTITSISGNSKQITSLGDVGNLQRKTNITLSTSSGNSFSYGVQVGQGGIDLNGSGTINGNVYANGPITGDSSSVITGTAISGNSPALSADQVNGSGVPSYDINFANTSGTQDIAQSFQITNSNPLNKIQVYIKKISTPSDITVKVVNDNGGNPGSNVLATGIISASTVTASYGWIDATFVTNPLLNTNTTYWLVFDAGASSSKYYTVGASPIGSYSNGVGKIGQFGGTWNNTTPSGLDYYFSVFLGGVNGLIAGSSGSQYNQLHIGTVSGTAQAHTINYTNSTGNIYCISGTGNNKSCTTQTDPTYISFPVSSANITQWEGEASSGGVYNGNYSVGYAGATLGPEKIIGDLNVSNGGTLTVTGTLWVTGNVVLDGGALIKLSSGYGTNEGVIIADGTITITGGGHATGSNTSGSYIMMLSNSYSSSGAITVSGGAGAVIVYAPNGTINVTGGASLKEATGYRVTVSGGSSITYESGLANSSFSSGPSGSWAVQTWGESQ